MTPPKRRTGPGYSHDPTGMTHRRAPAARRPSGARVDHGERRRLAVKRLRPRWHRVVGLLLLGAGVVTAALNDAMLLGGLPARLLPGGHSELYLFAGIALAAWSTWWFGWYDRAR